MRELAAGASAGPSGETGGEGGDSRRAPVPGRFGAEVPAAVRAMLVPEGSETVVGRVGEETRERRACRASVRGGIETSSGEILEHPADPGGAAVESDVHRGRRGAQLTPGSALQAHGAKPDACTASDLAVVAVAGGLRAPGD